MKKILLLFIVLFSGFVINTSSVYAVTAEDLLPKAGGIAADNGRDTTPRIAAPDCHSLFGDDPTNPDDFAYYLQIIFDVMKFAGIIIAVIMTVLDLTRMVSEQKDLDYAGFGKKTLKRIIYAVLIFILPNLLTYLLELIGLYGTCGIK